MTRTILAYLALAILLAAEVQGSEEALSSAASSGDISLVRQLIEAGADVNYKDYMDFTPLMWAAYNEDKDILKILIKAGADVNVSGPMAVMPKSHWYTPLMIAADAKDMEMFNLLIAAGADVNYQNDDGETALFRAIDFPDMDGTVEMVQALINAGADVNVKYPSTQGDHSGWTPLMIAIGTGHNEVCKLLIAAGSDLSYRNPRGETALLMATIYYTRDMTEVVKALVDAGADVNVSAEWNTMNFTPIMHAAMFKKKRMCKILMAAGAETDNISLRKEWEDEELEINEFLTGLE